jgi:superfamily I DNA/RNA helicase
VARDSRRFPPFGAVQGYYLSSYGALWARANALSREQGVFVEKKSPLKDKYTQARIERQKYVDNVLKSTSGKKIVVAGPGTGKTYLFKSLLEGKRNTLTLTFVNSLVEDLSLELCGLSNVRTLHAFARGQLKSDGENVKVFPKLSEVIRQDCNILLKKEVAFDDLFYKRQDDSEHLEFYLSRRQYYSHYGYTDIIWSLVRRYENEPSKTPHYDQVVVDEFQDFNKLEVSLIELLAAKSPILLAGDDDQALYDFKSASTVHIRERHIGAKHGYAPFALPFCSRCTQVIIDAANDVLDAAKKHGFLKGRIEKQYLYFEDLHKDEECARNSKIIHSRSYDAQIPWYIEKSIGELAAEVRGKFSVLIISPFRKQCIRIAEALKTKGFENIESVGMKDDKLPTLRDGLKILLDDKESNLGWRIVSGFLLRPDEFEDLVKQTYADKLPGMSKIIDDSKKNETIKMLNILRSILKEKEVNQEELDGFLKKVQFDHYGMAMKSLIEELAVGLPRMGNPSTRKIPINATTIQGSKGLAADYVFITHFDDRYFIKDDDKSKISDHDICSFLVALTRTKKRLFLISSDKSQQPTFLKWIDEKRIREG